MIMVCKASINVVQDLKVLKKFNKIVICFAAGLVALETSHWKSHFREAQFLGGRGTGILPGLSE